MGKNRKPKISICIPTFNRADLFEKTLQSVISQTKKPYEVIVVDNHSTDTTQQVVKKYLHYGITYYRNKKNIGFVGNWNKCVEKATGDYICILHADDLITKDWYEDWEKIIQKNLDVDAFFSSWAVIDIQNRVTSVYIPFPKNRKFKKNHVIKEFYSKNFWGPLVSGGLILRKDLFSKDNIGKFKEYLKTETDIAMFFPLMAQYSLYYNKKVLMGYRIHPFQTIDKKVEKMNEEKTLAAAGRYFTYLHAFYFSDLQPLLGKYDIFYKKLLIYYQFRAIFQSLRQRKMLLPKINTLIQQTFPNFLSPWEIYLYPYFFYEFIIKRFIVGQYDRIPYRNLFQEK